MLFYRIGEYFEEKAVDRSRSQIMTAADLRPQTVQRVHGDQIHTVPAEQAEVGDLLLVRPGDRIPLDGVVVSGESRIDTAPITGEPMPVFVGVGDSVISGCVNTSGLLTVRVEKVLSESMVTRILHAVENAAAGKPKIDRFITRFSRIYTPVVVGIALLTAVIPSLITGNWSYWVYTALSFLVMSCPCALVLSVPLAFFSGIGAGSRKGILFKGGASMEALAGIKVVALDKTGTLTKGEFRVQRVEGPENLLAVCACCEQSSTHPIAVSITAAAREQGLELVAPGELEEIPGYGIRAVLNGRSILCGSEKLLTRFGVACPKTGDSRVLVAEDGRYLGSILVADTLKPDAAQAIAHLKNMGLATALLTGDGEANACSIGEKTGITRICAQLLPEQKLTAVQTLRADLGPVLFVGDGINDAPVLAGADVGAAMGRGADAAIESADAVFLSS
jgi:Cd2+/Zn2+-exporting ATPase